MQPRKLAGGCLSYALFWLGCVAGKLGRFDTFGALYQWSMRGSGDWQDWAGWGPWQDVGFQNAQPTDIK
jgi:hypothetical protein